MAASSSSVTSSATIGYWRVRGCATTGRRRWWRKWLTLGPSRRRHRRRLHQVVELDADGQGMFRRGMVAPFQVQQGGGATMMAAVSSLRMPAPGAPRHQSSGKVWGTAHPHPPGPVP